VNFSNTAQADFILLLSIALVTLSTVISSSNIACKTCFLPGAFSKLNRVFDSDYSHNGQQKVGKSSGNEYRIEFRNVSFKYPVIKLGVITPRYLDNCLGELMYGKRPTLKELRMAMKAYKVERFVNWEEPGADASGSLFAE
jgi:hypothetical protein